MNIKTRIFGILGLLALLACSATAQVTVPTAPPGGFKLWAGTGTAMGTTNSYAVVSANSYNNGTPLVTYVNASSDLSTSKLQFYTVQNYADVTATNSTVTIYCASNGYTAGNMLAIIRHMSNDNYEKVALIGGGSNYVTAAAAPVTTTVPGDRVYFTTASGFIPVGAVTNAATSNPGGIFSGQPGIPLLVEIKGTSTASINVLNANYQ